MRGGAKRIDALWNRMDSSQRYLFLRHWYPDCWAVNSMALKKWNQLPAQFRFVLRTNPRTKHEGGVTVGP